MSSIETKNIDLNIIDKALIQNQLEALKLLSFLFLKEIQSLEEIQANVQDEVKSGHSISLNSEVQKFEINMIRAALIRSMGNQTKAAGLLGIKVSSLGMKIKRYNIDLSA